MLMTTPQLGNALPRVAWCAQLFASSALPVNSARLPTPAHVHSVLQVAQLLSANPVAQTAPLASLPAPALLYATIARQAAFLPLLPHRVRYTHRARKAPLKVQQALEPWTRSVATFLQAVTLRLVFSRQ